MVRGSGTKWDYELKEIIERVQLGEVAESSVFQFSYVILSGEQ